MNPKPSVILVEFNELSPPLMRGFFYLAAAAAWAHAFPSRTGL